MAKYSNAEEMLRSSGGLYESNILLMLTKAMLSAFGCNTKERGSDTILIEIKDHGIVFWSIDLKLL